MSSVVLTADATPADIAAAAESALPPKIRLQRSRDRLRLAMRRSAGLDKPAPTPGSIPAWAHGVLDKASAIPGVDIVIDVLRRWWANHPLRTAAHVAHGAAENIAAPLAQRNPIALVAGALVAGALVAKLRPWRLLPRTLMFAGLLPQLASRLVASVPLDTWISALTSHTSSARTPPSPAREASRRPG